MTAPGSGTAPDGTAGPSRALLAVLTLVLLAGVVLRVALFLDSRPLNVDEAMLALNIGTRSLGELARPLDYAQTAPLLFLLAERVAVTVAGMSEQTLRALPLLAGVLLPFAVWRLARRVAPPWTALLAVAFVAVSPLAIEYTATAKPYGVDALVAVLLAGWALDLTEAPWSRRRWWTLGVAGAVAIWASVPAVFALAGVWLALTRVGAISADAAGRRWLGALALVWAGLFAVQYLAMYRTVARLDYMQQFWEASFLVPDSLQFFARAWGAIHDLLFYGFSGSKPQPWGVVLFSAFCGAGVGLSLRRRGPITSALLIAPIAAAVLASAVHRYPVAARMMLFALPAIALFLATGLAGAAELVPGPGRRWVLGVVGTLWVALPASQAVKRPPRSEQTRSLVADVERLQEPGDAVYVYAHAVPGWAYYTTDWARPDTARLSWLAGVAAPGAPAFHSATARGRRVRDAGADLVRRYRGREEIIGVSSGTQWRYRQGWIQDRPDSGWAENEVARIRRGNPVRVWLVFADYARHTLIALKRGLRVGGAELHYQHLEYGAAAAMYRLP